VRRPQRAAMPAQNAAVEPLPLDPVTTNEARASRARSTASASSKIGHPRQADAGRPYFGRSNNEQSHRGKSVTPDFQNQVAAASVFQQPDRWVWR